MSEYPEHDKLHRIRDQSQACGEFIDWLASQGIFLATEHEHGDACRGSDGFRVCDVAHEEEPQASPGGLSEVAVSPDTPTSGEKPPRSD